MGESNKNLNNVIARSDSDEAISLLKKRRHRPGSSMTKYL